MTRAQLLWFDPEAGSGAYIAVDAITSLDATESSSFADQPLIDGRVATTDVVSTPGLLSFEVAQTNIPFDDIDERTAGLIPAEEYQIDLELPKTRFKPTGMLAVTLAAEQAIGAAVDAIGGLFGVEPPEKKKVTLFRPPYSGDRVERLREALRRARVGAYEIRLLWLGQYWTGYRIESVVFSRSNGSKFPRFKISLREMLTVSSEQAQIEDPAEPRLAAATNGGAQPAKPLTEQQKKDAAAGQESSLLYDLAN